MLKEKRPLIDENGLVKITETLKQILSQFALELDFKH